MNCAWHANCLQSPLCPLLMSHRAGYHLVARKFVSFLAVAPVLLLNYLITVRTTSSIIQYVNPRLRSSELQANTMDSRNDMYGPALLESLTLARIFLMGMQYEKSHEIETNKQKHQCQANQQKAALPCPFHACMRSSAGCYLNTRHRV